VIANPDARVAASEADPASAAHLGARTRAIVRRGVTDLLTEPRADAPRASQASLGTVLRVVEQSDRWYRVHGEDLYLGWLRADEVSQVTAEEARRWSAEITHRVSIPRAFIHAQPRVQAGVLARTGLRTPLAVIAEEERWFRLRLPDGRDGWIAAEAAAADDPVRQGDRAGLIALAHRLIETPYLWGGTTPWGLDCSGLVQLVYAAGGTLLPRDSDLQLSACTPLREADLRPGDLVGFPEHVGIYLDGHRLLHANGHHARVTIDSLDSAANSYSRLLAGNVTGYGRVPGW
jgi:cell wall-associated NlpC family hydrolase